MKTNELLCYLIEPVNDTTTSYFDGVHFQPDVNLALKFAKRELAEEFIQLFVTQLRYRYTADKFKSVEHIWHFEPPKEEINNLQEPITLAEADEQCFYDERDKD